MDKFNHNGLWSQTKSLFLVALPLSVGMISQNIMTVIDSVMVAQLGKLTLAAIGLGGFIVFIVNAATVGFSTYVQRAVSFAKGAGEGNMSAVALSLALLLCVLALPLYGFIVYQLLPALSPHFHEDATVRNAISAYVDVRLLALMFIGINFSFRGYVSALGLLRLYFFSIVLMHCSNVLLNYLLIYGNLGFPALGLQGAAIASVIATFIATLSYFVLLSRKQLLKINLQLSLVKTQFSGIVKVLIPYGVQQVLFVAGFATFLWIIGQRGVDELAVGGVVLNVSLLFFLPAIGFGLAAAGKISQALGAGQIDMLKRWFDLSMSLVFFLFSSLSVLLWVSVASFVAYFFEEAHLIALSSDVLRIAALVFVVEAASLVLMQALFAINKGLKATLLSSVSLWLFFLPGIFALVNFTEISLQGVWLCLAAYRFVNTVALYWVWKKEVNYLMKGEGKISKMDISEHHSPYPQ